MNRSKQQQQQRHNSADFIRIFEFHSFYREDLCSKFLPPHKAKCCNGRREKWMHWLYHFRAESKCHNDIGDDHNVTSRHNHDLINGKNGNVCEFLKKKIMMVSYTQRELCIDSTCISCKTSSMKNTWSAIQSQINGASINYNVFRRFV